MGCSMANCVRTLKVVADVRDKDQSPAQEEGRNHRVADRNINDMKKLLSEFSLGKVLGQGAFGVVYECAKKGSKDFTYAVKMVDKVETPVCDIEAEAEMLETLDHPNIVKLRHLFMEKFFVCIVMDKYDGGDLIVGMQKHWKNSGPIPCNKVIHVSRQMCLAIQYMHSQWVVHRDIKGDNYLMDRDNILDPECKIMLTDFGTAKEINVDKNERLTGQVGTKIYWPPEFFAGSYSLKVDLWALGVVMHGLLVGRFPFKCETDVRNKVVRLPAATPATCSQYILGLLEKDEKARFSADEAMAHPWLDNQHVDHQPTVHGEAGFVFNPERMGEGGPNAGVEERREELLARMEPPQQKLDASIMSMMEKDRFEVHTFNTKRTMKYEWWDEDRVKTGEEIINLSVAKPHVRDNSEHSYWVVERMLREHDIPVAEFGTNRYKTLEEFVAEVQNGSAVLMLDATEHRKLVRVADTVLVRIVYRRPGVDTTPTYLIEFEETFADGRTRNSSRLPGTKKEPHENTKTCAMRILRDVVGFGAEAGVTFDMERVEVFEEETHSPSFPHVRTVYRKEIVEGHVTATEPKVLMYIGVKSERNIYSYTESSRGNKRKFCWLTEEQCEHNSAELRPPFNGEDVSALVQAPVGYSEEDLYQFLDKNGVDPEAFGQKGAPTLKEFSTELVKGEASLMLVPRESPKEGEEFCDFKYFKLLGVSTDTQFPQIDAAYNRLCATGDPEYLRSLAKAHSTLMNPEGWELYRYWGERGPHQVVRVVDEVCLLLHKKHYASGRMQVLVMSEEKKPNGDKVPLLQLPGAKRRPDENHFLTAQRILKRQLKLDQNAVLLDSENVLVVESEEESDMYPNMVTLHRTRVITAHLLLPRPRHLAVLP